MNCFVKSSNCAASLPTVVEELLYAEHVAVVGHGHAPHAVGNGLVYQFLDTCLSVKNAVISMYVKMDEILHILYWGVSVGASKLRRKNETAKI